MKKFVCSVCGYVHEGDVAPEKCPVCKVPQDKFKEMEEGAAIAQAMDFIKEKDGGFGHELTIKGANLSGGQKQRVILSRALSGSPEILVLDDSSSALDYATDARLRKAIRERYDGREEDRPTTIIVAQRVSSIRHADLILVLEDGELVGKGKHEDLIQTCGVYQEIYYSQFSREVAHNG